MSSLPSDNLPATQADPFATHIETERLDAVLHMVSGLAHESRNALQRASACLDLLELGVADASESLQLTKRIRAALNDLVRSYEAVKKYAQPIVLTYSDIDVLQLCQSTFDELAAPFPYRPVQLRIIAGQEEMRAEMDASAMRTVFKNLLLNALAEELSLPVIDVGVGINVIAGREQLQITLRDYGGGVNSGLLPHAFEPYVTTRQQGVGLGLAVCRRIVTAHGGQIKLENHPAGGLQVRMTIPRSRRGL